MKCQRHKSPYAFVIEKNLKNTEFPNGILDFGSQYLSSCFPHKSGSELRRSMLWSLKVNRASLSEAFLSGKEKRKIEKILLGYKKY